LVGNDRARDYLTRILLSGNPAGSYIFSGAEGLGKTAAAKWLAQNLLVIENDRDNLEVSGDFYLVEREESKKNISIEQVRDLIHKLEMGSFAGGHKIAVIKDSQYLSIEAQNSLLKILEEPRDKVILILTVTDIENLVPTIISRCQNINFQLTDSESLYKHLSQSLKLNPNLARSISRLALGRPALATKFSENEEFYKNYISVAKVFFNTFSSNNFVRIKNIEELLSLENFPPETILDIWLLATRDLIFLKHDMPKLVCFDVLKDDFPQSDLGVTDIIAKIEKARDMLKSNINSRSVLETLLLSL